MDTQNTDVKSKEVVKAWGLINKEVEEQLKVAKRQFEKDSEKGVAVRFTSSNGVLKLAKGSHLMPGRRVHLTGTIAGFESAYTNADGEVVALDRPRIQLQAVQLTLGANPRA